MPPPDYRFQNTLPPCVTVEAPAIRRPRILRTTWTPTEPVGIDPEILARFHGSTVFAIRDGNPKAQRWLITRTSWDRPLEIVTPGDGVHSWQEEIKPPTTRTPGVWFAWETGEWKKRTCLADCHRYILRDHWHTPQYRKGQNMTPLPPTDYSRHQQSMEI